MSNYVNATGSNHLDKTLGWGLPTNTRVTNHNGDVTINARGGNDKMYVVQKGNLLHVTINGRGQVDVDVTKARSVMIAGGKGNDSIVVDPSVTYPLTLTGGMGNDQIVARNPGHNHVYGNSGFDHIKAKATDHVTYGNYMNVLGGHGTIYLPLAPAAQIPPPPDPAGPNLKITDPLYETHFGIPTGLNYELIPPEEIQALWNKVLYDSNNHAAAQQSLGAAIQGRDKIKKLQLLLQAALAGGNIDLAMLLLAGLETQQANDVAAGLMTRIQELQQKRQDLAKDMEKVGKDNPAKLTSLNNLAGDVGTEIQMLQLFLQDVMAQKNEAQQMASGYLKSKHDTAQAILRNF